MSPVQKNDLPAFIKCLEMYIFNVTLPLAAKLAASLIEKPFCPFSKSYLIILCKYWRQNAKGSNSANMDEQYYKECVCMLF